MYWKSDSAPARHKVATSIPDAIAMLGTALDLIAEALVEAERLNAEQGPPGTEQGDHCLEFRLKHPPAQPISGQIEFGLTENGLWMRDPFGNATPQTIQVRCGAGPWRPSLHLQVQYDISSAVVYLAPRCEKLGWASDPFDRLIAWKVDTDPVQERRDLQDAFTLLAKLRRQYGIPGGNFFGPRRALGQASLPPLNETDKLALAYIRENPGCKGDTVATAIGISPEHFRSRIWPKLRTHGCYNEDGYRPPKRMIRNRSHRA